MANTANRGGMKQGQEKDGMKKHQGVRKGSTATAKERNQVEKRKPVIDEERERRTAERSRIAESLRSGRESDVKRRKGPAAKRAREEAPQRRGQIKAGTGKKNLYANMPKARKAR
jgi:hypothetical protein